jgi:hypothetical protein
LFVASVVATLVCALVFPEYCVDEVRHHLQQGDGWVQSSLFCAPTC